MPSIRSQSLFTITALTAILAVSIGCNLHRANKAFDEGKFEEAARAYSRLVQQNPSNVKAKMGYKRSAVLAAEMRLMKAREAERMGRWDVVMEEIVQALRFDPQNSIALDWYAAIDERRNEAIENPDEDLRAIRDRIENESIIRLAPKESVLKEFNIPNQPLKQVFSILQKTFEINFLFHNTFTQGVDPSIQFSVNDMSLERILDYLALQNDLYYRYLDSKTVMVFKGGSNAAQRAEFENQQYKTLFLDNAKPNDIVTTLQRLLGQAGGQRIQLTPDNRLNALIVKGRPNDIKLITRMVRQLDKAKAEVMVYVELLEVTENSMEQVGLLPVVVPGTEGVYRMGATVDSSGQFNTNRGGMRISKSDLMFLFPSIQLDALKNSGEAKMAARQNMRIASDFAAQYNFGDKVFVNTGANSSTGAIGNTALSQVQQQYQGYNPYGGFANNYQQQDVGVKVTITPRVHHNDEITLDIKTDVTNQKASSNPERPNIGQRKLDTEVRMQNGETIIFGGLLREDEVKSRQGVWGIADIPIIGKMLGNNRRDVSKTDVLLTVRAVIVRKPDLRPDDFRAFDPDFNALQEELEAEQKISKRLENQKNTEAAPEPKAPTSTPAATTPPVAAATPPTATPATATPATTTPATTTPAATAPAATTQPASSGQSTDASRNTSGTDTSKTNETQPAATENTEANSAKKAENPPVESDLVIFLTPITSQITKGERYQINMMVSGGKGVTSGEFVFRIDPKLKLHGITGADFITREGGNVSSEPPSDGVVKVNFKKATGTTDSGRMLVINLEAVEKGNALIQVESYKCFIGEAQISAQIQNAIVEIE